MRRGNSHFVVNLQQIVRVVASGSAGAGLIMAETSGACQNASASGTVGAH
jgi:hypothetical protein